MLALLTTQSVIPEIVERVWCYIWGNVSAISTQQNTSQVY